MKHQLQTIRSALELATDGPIVDRSGLMQEALTALAEIERMAGEPYGTVTVVRKPGCADMHWFYRHPEPPYLDNAAECHTVYTTAPPAQQPQETEVQCPVCSHKFYEWPNDQQPQYEAGDMASAHNDGFRAGVASVTQQPQARPDFNDEWTGYLKDGETPFERFLRERKDLGALTKLYQRSLEENERLKAQQPQAEAVPMSQLNRLIAYCAASKLRELGYEWDEKAEAWAPQQVEAVPYAMHVTLTTGPAPWTNTMVPQAAFDVARAVFGSTSAQEDAKVYQTLQAALHQIAAPQQAEAVPEVKVTRPDEKADYGHDNSTPTLQTPYYCAVCDEHMGDVGSPDDVPLRKWAVCHSCQKRTTQAPQQAKAVPADQSKWCAYVAGVIGCYLGEADDSAKVKAIAGIIERRMWASASQPLKIAAWRGVHVEGDYLYYDEFPEELTAEQRRQLHLKPLYEAAPQQAEAVPVAMKVVLDAMRADPDYAWSWHCNVAMAFVDAGGDPYTANQGAARFMRLLANVDPAHELPTKQAEAVPQETLYLLRRLSANQHAYSHSELADEMTRIVAEAYKQAEAVPPTHVLVSAETLNDWKSRVNTLATLSIKAERYALGIKLKQDIADAAQGEKP